MAAQKTTPKRRKPSSAQQDRRLRERLAVVYADPNIDVDIQLANLEKLVRWVKEGKMPAGVKPELRVVENKAG